MNSTYRGRFAPSPTGPLHAGSLVAALASWLDARAHDGRWLVRIEDVDGPRCPPGMDRVILQQLARCGLMPDEPPVWQSHRSSVYACAMQRLLPAGQAYACACTRADIETVLTAAGNAPERFVERVYPGTCRAGLQGKPARATRFKVPEGIVRWTDRRIGPQQQDVADTVGDFVVQRADGLWAYQLAVVVDDGEQGITHVVRGEDLADNTARQIQLQRALGLITPQYLHTELVRAIDGRKLSKQNGAAALLLDDEADVLCALYAAAQMLGLRQALDLDDRHVRDQLATAGIERPGAPLETVPDFLSRAVQAWAGIIAGVPVSPIPQTTKL